MSVAGSLVLAVGHGWTSCSGGTTEGQPGLFSPSGCQWSLTAKLTSRVCFGEDFLWIHVPGLRAYPRKVQGLDF